MKKFLFDGISTQGSKGASFHGGGEYAKFILKSAIEYGYKFDIVFYKDYYTEDYIENLVNNNPNIVVYKVGNKNELYKLIDRNRYDYFYSALPYEYYDYKCKATLIGVIHGLRTIELPWDDYRYKYYMNFLMRFIMMCINHVKIARRYLYYKYMKALKSVICIPNSQFITVSEHSKYSLLAFFPFLKETDISVFYSPFNIIKRQDIRKSNYFLMVSANRFEKNSARAVEVFDELFNEGRLSSYRVVITGCTDLPFLRNIRNKDKFDLKPYVSTEELENLYSEAFCFVYPTLNEGFGYPPLKAMGYGTPVIASSSTSIPEVCADAALYFIPTCKFELKNRILQITENSTLYKSLVLKGEERVSVLLDKQSKELTNELSWIFNRK